MNAKERSLLFSLSRLGLIQLKHKDTFSVGNLKVTAIHTPCHTQDHICYYVEDKAKNERCVFTGSVSKRRYTT
jgi:glyoxylase-like metal-dependent hydrolase (beta-lactamase superfamily II)